MGKNKNNLCVDIYYKLKRCSNINVASLEAPCQNGPYKKTHLAQYEVP